MFETGTPTTLGTVDSDLRTLPWRQTAARPSSCSLTTALSLLLPLLRSKRFQDEGMLLGVRGERKKEGGASHNLSEKVRGNRTERGGGGFLRRGWRHVINYQSPASLDQLLHVTCAGLNRTFVYLFGLVKFTALSAAEEEAAVMWRSTGTKYNDSKKLDFSFT